MLFLLLTFIVIVFTLIFFLSPVSSNKSGSSSTTTYLNLTKSYGLISKEQQIYLDGITTGDIVTNVTVEEQNMVENSLAQQGFVPQENGTSFYFVKNK